MADSFPLRGRGGLSPLPRRTYRGSDTLPEEASPPHSPRRISGPDHLGRAAGWSFRKRRFDADAVEINEFMHDDGAAPRRRHAPTPSERAAPDAPAHRSEYGRVGAGTARGRAWSEGPLRSAPRAPLPRLIRGARAGYWASGARAARVRDTIPPAVLPV